MDRDQIVGRSKRQDSQPAVAAVGAVLEVREQSVDGIAIEGVGALPLAADMPTEHQEEV